VFTLGCCHRTLSRNDLRESGQQALAARRLFGPGVVDLAQDAAQIDGSGFSIKVTAERHIGGKQTRLVKGPDFRATWARRIGDNPNPTATGNDQDGSLISNRFWLAASLPF
jgi:hypothetical protein